MLSIKRMAFIFTSLFISLTITIQVHADTAIIDEDNLNVRSGPGIDNNRIHQIHSGEEYKIIDKDGEWVEIELDDKSGWITTDFITIHENNNQEDEVVEETLQESDIETIIIIHDQTQIRSGNGTDYDIISFASQGEKFDVISESSNWFEISNGDITGFISKSLLETNNYHFDSSGLKGKNIMIDPGHGGRDVGAIGISDSYESDFTQFTAYELEKKLNKLGANVISTRPGNEFIPLESRTTLANSVNIDAFLSLHYNSFPEMPTVTGIETFYYHPQHEEMATFIHDEIVKATGDRDREISSGDFHVIRQTFKPGVLLELGFISNEESFEQLITPAYQKQIVTGIVNGLHKYFAHEE